MICVELGAGDVDFSKRSASYLQRHAEKHRIQLDDDGTETKDLLFRCYPNADDGQNLANNALKKSTSTVSTNGRQIGFSRRGWKSTAASGTCLRLLKEFRKGGKLFCRLCSKGMVARQKGAWFYTRPAIDHATTVHLKKPLYFCKRCSKTSASISTMYHHVKGRHRVGATNNYVDISGEFETEIIRTIKECYDQNFKKRSEVKIR